MGRADAQRTLAARHARARRHGRRGADRGLRRTAGCLGRIDGVRRQREARRGGLQSLPRHLGDGFDVYQYGLAAGTQRKLTRLSTAAGSETAPSIASGAYGFARRGGSRPGTYTATRTRVRRIDARVARETAVTASRIAYRLGDTIAMSALDGARRRTLVTGLPVFSVVITRYRVGWLQRIGHRTLALMTDRINPSGKVTIRRGSHDLPASTQSAVADASRIVEYLGKTGIKRADPPLFR